MPTQTAIWLAVVVTAFGGFAVVLAWADHYTHAGGRR